MTPAIPFTSSLTSVAQHASPITEQTISAKMGDVGAKTGLWTASGRLILFLLSIIPGVLYWLITFTTITLPTWLFTLFSTSLTFTMNATTLYVSLTWPMLGSY
jgi:lysophospholipid hydrolase